MSAKENIEFLKAKDGKDTCKINSVFMHSGYSPEKEAERFVENIKVTFNPEIIFILEPGMSYCVPYLKKRFPSTQFACIRLVSAFDIWNNLFDYCFSKASFKSYSEMCNHLYNVFGENILAFSTIAVWEPSGRIFQEDLFAFFNAYKNLIEKCHSILRTRSFFEKRWLTNTVNIIKNTRNYSSLSEKGSKPVLICASGPSLIPILPFLKSYGNNFFIMAVSSAALPLISRGIIPNIIISTDGGFWAKKHLEILRNHKEIILALAVEGNCPNSILKQNNILPLTYSDGMETKLFNETGIQGLEVNRCGTVSGTALDLATKISHETIYFAGLDLHAQKGFQHTQVNALENGNAVKDIKLSTTEKRTCTQGFSNQAISLKMYEDWFSSLKSLPERKIFRIIDESYNSLGNIIDISSETFINEFSKTNKVLSDPKFITKHTEQNKEYLDKICAYITSSSEKEEWKKDLFVSDYLNYKHTTDENLKRSIQEKITTENRKLLDKLCRLTTKN